MRLDRAAVAERVPHSGSMCLLDEVDDWDDDSIVCRAVAPDATHPLARNGIVPVVAAVEYAAQATAVHGALLSGGTFRGVGVLAKLTQATFHPDALAPLREPLTVRVFLISRSERGCLYRFSVSAAAMRVAHGTLMVALGEVTLS